MGTMQRVKDDNVYGIMINVQTKTHFSFFLTIVFFLIVMHFFTETLSPAVHNRFDLNAEANIPTWYSTILLFLVFLCSLVIFLFHNKVNDKSDKWSQFWIYFASVFAFLSLDEAARLHELLSECTSVKWVYMYAPFSMLFFLFCVIYFVVVRNDEKYLQFWVIGGLFLYAFGGIFLEYISYSFNLSSVLQLIEFVLEEGLEMVGTIMILMGCLQELNDLVTKMAIVK